MRRVPPVGLAAEDARDDGPEGVEGQRGVARVEARLVVVLAPSLRQGPGVRGLVRVEAVARVPVGAKVVVVVVALEDLVVEEEPVGVAVDVGREEGGGGLAVALGDEGLRDVVEEARDDEVVAWAAKG